MWNKKLLILNGLAITAVVMNHAAHWGFTSIFWWAHSFRPVESPNFDMVGSPAYWALSIILQLTIFSVPAFIFASGFFVAYAAKGPKAKFTWKMVQVRVVSLLIPYLVWSLVIFVGDYLQGFSKTPLEYLRLLLIGDAVDAYFFVPLLIQLYILSPLLVPLAKSHWKLLLVVALLLQLFAQALVYRDMLDANLPVLASLSIPKWVFVRMGFYFVFGLVVGLRLEEFKNFLARTKWYFLAVALVALLLAIVEYHAFAIDSDGVWVGDFGSLLNSIFAVSLIASYFAFDLAPLSKASQLPKMGRRSYGIYLLHQPILTLLSKILYHVAPGIFAYQVLYFLLLVAVGLGLPYAVMEIVSRTPLRRYYKYLFG
jgi:peptidoglycan/LPS O-acetylase OafA/YrhL